MLISVNAHLDENVRFEVGEYTKHSLTFQGIDYPSVTVFFSSLDKMKELSDTLADYVSANKTVKE